MHPKDQIKSILAEKLGLEVSDVEGDSLLAEDLGIDAATLADLLEIIKEKTGVEVPIEDIKEAKSVDQLINIVEENTLE